MQVIYPATRNAALHAIYSATRETQAAGMRQALALLRWAHKFGPEDLVQRAERYLGDGLHLFARVRSQLHLSHAGTAPDAGRRHWSGSLQADTPRSFELDAVFECLAFADRMSLHAVAAKCEWALTQLWRDKSVHTRAVLELSPEAVHRVARSLSAMIREDERRAGHFDSNYMGARWQAPESAETMMQWRMS